MAEKGAGIIHLDLLKQEVEMMLTLLEKASIQGIDMQRLSVALADKLAVAVKNKE